MPEIQYDKSVQIKPSVTLMSQPPEKQVGWASKASQLLHLLGGEHTFQPPIEKLQYAMSIGHATVATDLHGELAGYVKMSPWVVNSSDIGQPVMNSSMSENAEDFEQIHSGAKVPVCLEIGSLVVGSAHQGKNVGKALVTEMLAEAKASYPQLPKIAVVTNDNVASLKVFQKLLWNTISREDAIKQLGIDVLDGWEPESTIFIHSDN